MKSYSKILLALGLGAAVGSILAIVFAPGKGSETRKKLSDGALHLTDRLRHATGKISSSGDHTEKVVHNGKSHVSQA